MKHNCFLWILKKALRTFHGLYTISEIVSVNIYVSMKRVSSLNLESYTKTCEGMFSQP